MNNNYTEPKKILCGICKEELLPCVDANSLTTNVSQWFCPKCNMVVSNIIYIYER